MSSLLKLSLRVVEISEIPAGALLRVLEHILVRGIWLGRQSLVEAVPDASDYKRLDFIYIKGVVY